MLSGFMLFVDTPYFDKTDDRGKLSLSLEQPGRYQITLWHPQLEAKDHKLTQVVNVSGATHLNWKLPKKLIVQLPQVSQDEFDFLDKY